jgi:hypothetical protein
MVVGEGEGRGRGRGRRGRGGEAGCQFVSFRRDFKPHPGKSCFRPPWKELKTAELLKAKRVWQKVSFHQVYNQRMASKNKGRDGACSKAT